MKSTGIKGIQEGDILQHEDGSLSVVYWNNEIGAWCLRDKESGEHKCMLYYGYKDAKVIRK